MIIGLDVGGTHTDVVLLGREGLIREFKVRTNPADLFSSVLTGLERITEGIDPADIERAVLSTTLTTNAMVQARNPRVGMIVSAGPGIDPAHYQTNEFYHAVSGSIDHRGREVDPIDPAEIDRAGEAFREAGIRNIGIVGKFSVRNPAHELDIRDRLKTTFGDAFGKMFMGHRVSGNLNFARRIATTYLNTAVYQEHKKFYEAVGRSLASKGLVIPIHILKADGGTMSFESSIDFPGQAVLSGPSASVMGASAFASPSEESLVLDIGGTTTDMAILINGAPLLDPLGITLDGVNTLIRSLQSRSIGVGGDSVIRVEEEGLRVGPDRVGPAMAYGGESPTPTDALFVLGKGTEDGDREASRAGVATLAESLGVDPETAAQRIVDQACRQILDAARDMVDAINRKPVYTVHELREGHKVDPRRILILGGPAPYFADRLAELAEMPVDLVPRWTVANAVGAALARSTCEVSFFADTQQEIATAPEEEFSESVDRNFSLDKALEKAFALLRKKALAIGAAADDLEMEVVEQLQFNMVRGFYTAGRNIRVKVQVKPGLIHEYEDIARRLRNGEAAAAG